MTNTKTVLECLRESNAIEDVFDNQSLHDAMRAWEHLNKFKKLSKKILNETHGILMKSQPMEKEWKGNFRQCPVWIGGREGKPWYVVPELMHDWIMRINHHILNKSIFKDIEAIIKEDHVIAEVIHPYIDGNGRIFRIALNWQRIQCGLPILVILAKERQKYYKWFE